MSSSYSIISTRPLTRSGTVTAPRLSTEPMTVEGGRFELLVADDPDPAVRHMHYRLPLVTVSGEHYFFDGFKTVSPGAIGDLWPATSTLYVTLRDSDRAGRIIGRGVLHIKPRDFIRQLRTMEVTGSVGVEQRLATELKFGSPSPVHWPTTMARSFTERPRSIRQHPPEDIGPSTSHRRRFMSIGPGTGSSSVSPVTRVEHLTPCSSAMGWGIH